jgi:hypothetical protein
VCVCISSSTKLPPRTSSEGSLSTSLNSNTSHRCQDILLPRNPLRTRQSSRACHGVHVRAAPQRHPFPWRPEDLRIRHSGSEWCANAFLLLMQGFHLAGQQNLTMFYSSAGHASDRKCRQELLRP